MDLDRGELKIYRKEVCLNKPNDCSEMIIDLIDAVTIIAAASNEIKGRDEVRSKISELLDHLKLYKQEIRTGVKNDD